MADTFNVLDVFATPFGPILLKDGEPVNDLRGSTSVMRMLDVAADIFVDQLELGTDEAERLAIELLLGRPTQA